MEKFFFLFFKVCLILGYYSCQIFKPSLQLPTVLYVMILNKQRAFVIPCVN